MLGNSTKKNHSRSHTNISLHFAAFRNVCGNFHPQAKPGEARHHSNIAISVPNLFIFKPDCSSAVARLCQCNGPIQIYFHIIPGFQISHFRIYSIFWRQWQKESNWNGRKFCATESLELSNGLAKVAPIYISTLFRRPSSNRNHFVVSRFTIVMVLG